MTKQKSMGKIAHDVFYRGDYFWCELTRESVWHEVAKAVIAEHERRKRAPCYDCQHVGSGSCKSCRYWMAKHAPSYFERKRAKSKKVKK